MKLKKFLKVFEEQNCLDHLIEDGKIYLSTDMSDVVDGNHLSKLADALSCCVDLQEFILQYGFIGLNPNNINYGIIFNSLKKCQKLKTFDIAFNHAGNLSNADVEALSDFIADSNLENINLQDNELSKLSYDNLFILFAAIAKCKNLKCLNISHNNFHIIDDDKFDVICDTLSRCKSLLNFYMSVPYISSKRQEKLLKITNRIKQNQFDRKMDIDEKCMFILNKDPMQSMILFCKPDATDLFDEKEQKLEETAQVVSVERNSNTIPKCILM